MTQDERFDRIDDSNERLTRYVLELRDETAHRLDVIDHRLDMISATVASLDSRLPPLTKAILDSGSLAAQLAREQSREKALAADLAARLDRLEEKLSKLIDPAA